ncbi:MAG: CoA transferase [Betaproteobacteria bacterium]|nr:CoA transferase [Betaproteobacteria bacterium]
MSALAGIRVLDLGTFIAGPYCATLLAEFGAEVIKVEAPEGDSLRRFGTETGCGDTLVWLSESRNKKCVTLNLRTPRGVELLKALVSKSDVVVENFRPGVMEKWGLGVEDIRRINKRAVVVRVSAYGQDGPYKDRPGFARVAHAFSGLAYLAGEPGRVPVVPGSTSLADYMSGIYGALGALMALRARDTTGEGQCVDLALYESVFRVLDELVPAYDRHGFVRERMGADTVNVCPHSHYRTKDGKWIAIACSNDAIFVRLAAAMGRPELAGADLYGPKDKRLAARDEVNGLVAGWVAALDCEDVLRRCEEAGAPASLIYSIADIFEDPQYRARGNIRTVDSRAGPLAVPDVVPRLTGTPGEIRWLGAGLGAHNAEVLGGVLGLGDEELERLRAQGVI